MYLYSTVYICRGSELEFVDQYIHVPVRCRNSISRHMHSPHACLYQYYEYWSHGHELRVSQMQQKMGHSAVSLLSQRFIEERFIQRQPFTLLYSGESRVSFYSGESRVSYIQKKFCVAFAIYPLYYITITRSKRSTIA